MSTISEPLTDARRLLEQVEHSLEGAGTEGLRAAVEGVHEVTRALAAVTAALMEQVPVGLDDQGIAKEVVADLRAMHGCLTTSTLLLAPALEDLRGLTSPEAATVPRQQNPLDRPMPIPA
ncbi:hypothetical protein SAMN05192558_107257 [Actinokineospora alba]|uniref:Uncharacterized protein n=1 Tax=Actinokineospora alba TaxID=504798 RepID=A0A1H0R2X4_9PSEU|nr:hypothetical protein [Actinokineospora alba]TDP70291.1 hypothetical protein C8E96_5894 [Actinokineospora alba]SDI34860.1 hypothetical protein SAMN05421871_104256 [Actinokineospora alba]SDP23416.1 hypothetical protein SAMN05192558_107257 [Actinokineospora alba]